MKLPHLIQQRLQDLRVTCARVDAGAIRVRFEGGVMK
jgi:hypothetical protein